MSRSSKKGPYVDQKLLKKLAKFQSGDTKNVVNTYARASEISPEMIGYTIGVHNGRKFILITIKEEMVGHRLGEFSLTKTFVKHGGKIQKDLEQKAAISARETAKKEKA